MKIKFKAAAAVIITGFYLYVSAQDMPAYRIVTGEGRGSGYADMLAASMKSDVVFFGELHDNPVSHWLQLELIKDIYPFKRKGLVLAMEMFERDNQLIIDEYLKGLVKETSFEAEVRLWPNYRTDYKPLLNFAKQKELKVIASNIPRRYASNVASGGFEALLNLPKEALAFIAPLPVEYNPELQCYKDIVLSEAHSVIAAKYRSYNLSKAQAIKDATMAHSIFRFREKGQIIVHINGSYHSDRKCGIVWYLNKYSPGLKITTISTVVQDGLDALKEENRGKADFVIMVPSTMTRTH
jgi:uncharacterized iron-regulated protein